MMNTVMGVRVVIIVSPLFNNIKSPLFKGVDRCRKKRH